MIKLHKSHQNNKKAKFIRSELKVNIFVFDIETVPDVEAGRKLLQLNDISDEEVAECLFSRQRAKNGSDFLPHYLQKIVAISLVFHLNDQIKVWSLADETASERAIIQRFFAGLEKYSPDLVSWNGAGFDLPVLHYRALVNQISAPRYWEKGDYDQQFKWNNYINRFHYRHLDLMDILSGYQGRASAPLDEIATMLGFPGKMGMNGANVWQAYFNGDIKGIRDYCETDVLNTYLVYLQFEVLRGQMSVKRQTDIHNQLKHYLQQQNKSHFNQFLANWGES
jgi:predicted PolB exonuclease-like 3'-5' exonuclease